MSPSPSLSRLSQTSSGSWHGPQPPSGHCLSPLQVYDGLSGSAGGRLAAGDLPGHRESGHDLRHWSGVCGLCRAVEHFGTVGTACCRRPVGRSAWKTSRAHVVAVGARRLDELVVRGPQACQSGPAVVSIVSCDPVVLGRGPESRALTAGCSSRPRVRQTRPRGRHGPTRTSGHGACGLTARSSTRWPRPCMPDRPCTAPPPGFATHRNRCRLPSTKESPAQRTNPCQPTTDLGNPRRRCCTRW